MCRSSSPVASANGQCQSPVASPLSQRRRGRQARSFIAPVPVASRQSPEVVASRQSPGSFVHCGQSPVPKASSLKIAAATTRKVRFADDVGGVLAEVIEVKSLKILSRFTKKDKANAEAVWHAELLAQLMDESSAVQQNALQRLEGYALELALSDDTYRIVLKAAEVAHLCSQEEIFMREFYGYVRILALSASGSEVLEKCMDTLGPIASFSIANELVGFAVEAALHEIAYNVVCHLLENQSPEEIEPIVDELRMAEERLAADPWGNCVLEVMP